jgi:ribonuclease HI
MKKIEIYTDGSCLGNPGPGGWGAILIYNGTKKEISGTDLDTTNNKMELTAAIKALEKITQKCSVDLYTDSSYLKDGITKWSKNWQKNNWRGSNKKPVKNQELWQELIILAEKHHINWHWVKAHAGNEVNEEVDALARSAALKSI